MVKGNKYSARGRAGTESQACPISGREFPVRDGLRIGESGQGYSLRMAVGNLLNGLSEVKSMLGKSRFAVLDASDAPTLSQWFGGDLAQLERALGKTGIGGEPTAYEFGGHSLSRSYFVNRSQPRVCAQCLSEDGYCQLSWEVSITCACAKHRELLRANCPGCLAPLRWDRPHLVQCRCGWSIQLGKGQAPTESEIEVSGWVERQLSVVTKAACTTTLGRVLSPLGLDAGLHVLAGLASAAPVADTPKSVIGSLRKRNSLVVARIAIAKATETLGFLLEGQPFTAAHARIPVRIPFTAAKLLAEAVAHSYEPAERQLAMSLIKALGGRKHEANWSGRHPQLSQLELFQ